MYSIGLLDISDVMLYAATPHCFSLVAGSYRILNNGLMTSAVWRWSSLTWEKTLGLKMLYRPIVYRTWINMYNVARNVGKMLSQCFVCIA